jgi:Rrf2 family transcriptional regulator, iron-sulfur cluster assembly transcription factor
MRISRKSKIAFHVLLDIAAHTAVGKAISISHISKRHSLSHSYLELIFSQLKAARFIKSHRGPRGGYSLAKKVEDISFYDVMCLFDKSELTRQDLGVFLWADLEKYMKIQTQSINLAEALKKSSIAIEESAKAIGFSKLSIKLPKVFTAEKPNKDISGAKKILGPNSVFVFGNYLKGI